VGEIEVEPKQTPSEFSASLSQFFDEVGVSARVLLEAEAVELDKRLKTSGDIAGDSLDFAATVPSVHLDAGSAEEVREFLVKELSRYESESLFVLEDSENHGFELGFHEFIQSLIEILGAATGHVYVLNGGLQLIAIVKSPFWTSVRADCGLSS